jgi:hypothetical protein
MYDDIKFWIAHEIVKIGIATIVVALILVVMLIAALIQRPRKKK